MDINASKKIIKPKTNKNEWLVNLGKDIYRDKLLYLMLIPFVAFFIIFLYKPMYGLQIAFKDYDVFTGIADSPWVGIDNFKTFFKGPFFGRLFTNTIMISLYNLAFAFPAPIILALLFNEVRNKKFKTITQTCVYIPHFVSVVVVAGLVVNFLSPGNGIINTIISIFGGDKIYFLIEPKYFRGIYTAMNIWKSTGFSSIIYLSALAGVDSQLYEAAVIDGANKWKQLWHITIPGILPTIVMMLIMTIGNLLNVGYEAIILLYQPSTYETADVINTYVYRAGLIDTQYSLAAAVGMFNGVVGLILVCSANAISKRVTEYGLW